MGAFRTASANHSDYRQEPGDNAWPSQAGPSELGNPNWDDVPIATFFFSPDFSACEKEGQAAGPCIGGEVEHPVHCRAVARPR